MNKARVLVLSLAVVAGCATANPVRSAASSGDLVTQKLAAFPKPEQLEGVWLDSGGTAMLWVKAVDGEYRAFLQDSVPFDQVDPQILMEANDDGAKSRALAQDWPFPKGSENDPKGALSYVITGKLVPGTDGVVPGIIVGAWEYAHSCHGEPIVSKRDPIAYITSMTTNGGLQIINVQLKSVAKAGSTEPEPAVPFGRMYQFGKLAEPLKGSMKAEIENTKNFCRTY